jgi:hypothetical protein
MTIIFILFYFKILLGCEPTFFFFQSFYFCGNGEHDKSDFTLNGNPILKNWPKIKIKILSLSGYMLQPMDRNVNDWVFFFFFGWNFFK